MNCLEMKAFTADLHIHTVLSPCGGLDMSPVAIIKRAKELQLDLIGVCDHNHTGHGKLMRRLGNENGLSVITGVEITTKEEVHCLAFFENDEQLDVIQQLIDNSILKIPNDTKRFGYQLLVDEEENVLDEIGHLLISATQLSVEEWCHEVHKLGGLFIPAHVNRPSFSLLSQLGFIPRGLQADALEVASFLHKSGQTAAYESLVGYTLITGSDAHHLAQIGQGSCTLVMNSTDFGEFGLCLSQTDGRRVEL